MKGNEISRRKLLKGSAATAVAAVVAPAALSGFLGGAREVSAADIRQAPLVGSRNVTGVSTPGSRARVYFIRILTRSI